MNRRLILGLIVLIAVSTLSFASAADISTNSLDKNILSLDDDAVFIDSEADDSFPSNLENENLISSIDGEEWDASPISSDVDRIDKNKIVHQGNSLSVSSNDELFSDGEEEKPDEPDLIVNNTIYLTKDNFNTYFDDGVLKSWFGGNTIIFAEDFENLGKLTIQAEDVIINGLGHTLKNTVFELDAQYITLSNLNIVLDSEYPNNEYAGIAVYSDNALLKNLNINYVVPDDVQAFAVYAEGSRYDPIKNLRIVNNTINFEGHNNNARVYNHALRLESCIDALVSNNTISSALPLRDINFGANGAQLASDLVLTVGIDGCDNLMFIGNTILSEVNKRPQGYYPSLDSVFVSDSNNAIIANNSISLTDFITYKGLDNYLYALDIYNLENLTVSGNNISVRTTGGKLAAGTAYPIQITGPIDNVDIVYNDLFSYSNGPNIGIYSQNYYGSTALHIAYNRINVTGLAGEDEWALVAGIETQDTNSDIHNNIIEVHSVGEVTENDNLYGVSYGQHTDGDHQYNIHNNTVFSDGYYSVNLISSNDSTVADNLLVSYNPNATNSNGFKYGDLSAHEGIEFSNNSVVSAFDYFANRENNVDNGHEYYYNPFIDNEISNVIDGSRISDGESKNQHSYNPLIPGSSSDWGIHTGEDGWTINMGGYSPQDGSDDSNGNQMSLNDLLYNYISAHSGNSNKSSSSSEDRQPNDFFSNTNGGKTNVTSYKGHSYVIANNSDISPSDSGPGFAASLSKSSFDDSGSVAKKAYNIDRIEDMGDKMSISPIILVIILLLLLLIGYKWKKFILE